MKKYIIQINTKNYNNNIIYTSNIKCHKILQVGVHMLVIYQDTEYTKGNYSVVKKTVPPHLRHNAVTLMPPSLTMVDFLVVLHLIIPGMLYQLLLQ